MANDHSAVTLSTTVAKLVTWRRTFTVQDLITGNVRIRFLSKKKTLRLFIRNGENMHLMVPSAQLF